MNGWNDRENVTALMLLLKRCESGIVTYSRCIKRNWRNDASALGKACSNLRSTSLTRLAYPNLPAEFAEHLAIQALIDGIRDEETQQAIGLAMKTALHEALALAHEYKAAKRRNSHTRITG